MEHDDTRKEDSVEEEAMEEEAAEAAAANQEEKIDRGCRSCEGEAPGIGEMRNGIFYTVH